MRRLGGYEDGDYTSTADLGFLSMFGESLERHKVEFGTLNGIVCEIT